jgi:hypothetical protein
MGFIVPASIFKYMSHLRAVTFMPRDFRRRPIEAAVTPFPKPDNTPPEIIMNFIE